MRYTNKHNLPDHVIDWLLADDYDHNHNAISATSLIKPTRAYVLEKQYSDKLELDYSDLIASRYGSAFHASFENVKTPYIIKEKRLFSKFGNLMLTGKFDMVFVRDGSLKLGDIKSTSVWSYIYNSRINDYIKQLSIYRYLMSENHYKNIEQEAEITYIFTDWKRVEARRNKDYPQTRIVTKTIPLLSYEQTLSYILERLKAIVDAQTNLPDCNLEELWYSGSKFAVMKDGRKTALRVFETEKEANIFSVTHPTERKLKVVQRTGTVGRCEYCSARNFCEQYKELCKNGYIENYEGGEKDGTSETGENGLGECEKPGERTDKTSSDDGTDCEGDSEII